MRRARATDAPDRPGAKHVTRRRSGAAPADDLLNQPRVDASRTALVLVGILAMEAFVATSLLAPMNALLAIVAGIAAVSVVVVLVSTAWQGRPDGVTALTGMLAFAFIIPAPYAVRPLGGAGTPAMIACGGLAMVWLVVSVFWPTAGTPCRPLRRAALFLLIAALASFAAASARRIEHAEVKAADRGLIMLLSVLGVSLFTAELVKNRARLFTLLDRLLVLTTFLAAIGIAQFEIGFDVIGKMRVPGLAIINTGFVSTGERSHFARVAGTMLHPIEFGFVLAMLFPIALHRALYPPAGRQWIRRWGPVILMGMAIAMSLSRTATLGVLVSSLVLIPTWPKERIKRAVIMGPAFLVAMRLAFPGLIGTGFALFTSVKTDPSTTARTARYTVAGDLINQAPWFGRGIKTLLPPLIFDNQYLETLIEMGILGLIALITILFLGFWMARQARRLSHDVALRDLAQSVAASIAVPIVGFATFDAMSFSVATIMTFFMIGIAGALMRISREENQKPTLVDVSAELAREPAVDRDHRPVHV